MVPRDRNYRQEKNVYQYLISRGEMCPWKSEGKSEESLVWEFLSPDQRIWSNTGCLCKKNMFRAGRTKKDSKHMGVFALRSQWRLNIQY